ncbi:MAG: tetratricopeptide repeat protein, partial [Candidatus Komeilibacteria bacterium]|nr:tetratricopeptide repeat protein [Candidatus Komeilibacteria bacterium]
ASRKTKPDVTTVSNLVAQAVNEAKIATDLSPKSVALWENLSTMYENAAALVPDARNWAVKSLIQASELEPSNPVLFWRLGNNYSLAGNWADAIKSYKKAIDLKKDYVGAYLGLASAYEQNKEMDKAVDVYKTVLPAGISNPEFLFNFGRLLYNRNGKNDRDDSEKLWQEAVRLQPNYSNAIYSLGLLYEARGDKATALQYYYKVKDLNPENKDVVEKIRNLVGAAPKE